MRFGWVFLVFLVGCESGKGVKIDDSGQTVASTGASPTGAATGTGTGAGTGTGTGAATGTGTGAATGTGTGAATGTGTGTGTGGTTIPAGCGDGVYDPTTEACDDGNNTAGDGCRADCAGTEQCGDGLLDSATGETCDDGVANDDVLSDACRTGCAVASCGDQVVDFGAGEACDDGNLLTNDGCDQCAIVAPVGCGDGTWDIAAGEECDDGNQATGDGCDDACQLEAPAVAACGDGSSDPLEACDDGNNSPGDGCNPSCTNGGTTSLFAGTPGTQGYVDATGSSAELGGYGTLAIDSNYLYYADGSNHVIRRIDLSNGDVSTIAGDGNQAHTDATVGTNASFWGLEAIATDGNKLWVADGRWMVDAYIREIDLSCPDPTTNCYAVTTRAGSSSTGQNDGAAIGASFDDLRGLTYYAGALYFLDGNAATLRTLDLSANTVSTLAGQAYSTGNVDGVGAAARMISPRYMTSDNSGNLYIADTNGNQIRSYNTVTGYLGTFAGDGTQGYVDAVGTAARIHRPRGMASDGSSIYWVEFNQHTIRQGEVATRSVTTHVGQVGQAGYAEGTGVSATLSNPFALAWDWQSGRLYVLDGANYVIRRID